MFSRKLLLAAFVAAASPFALSHGIWVAERTGEPTIVFGDGAEDTAYDPAKVIFVQGFDHDGKAVEVALNKKEKNISLGGDADFHTVAAVLDNGFYSQDANGKWVNKPKNEVEGAQKSGHYIKSNVSVLEEGKLPAIEALEPLKLVILPTGNVIDTDAGDKVDVVVYFEGKPLPNAEIIGDYVGDPEKVVAKTDENGKASVPVRNNGLNVIATSHKTPPPEADKEKADSVGYNATLSFVNFSEE